VRDLAKKNQGVEINNGFKPIYEISPDKKKVIAELEKLAKEAETVWLASDEDREGEAISWHLMEALQLKQEKTKRIVFHEITKNAITEAIKSPRGIDENLVDAQQARRVLDRLVGFELSPVLWRKVKPSLSAGRVQSVAVRLIVEREKEIKAFKPVSSFRVTAVFRILLDEKTYSFQAELPSRFDTENEAQDFLNHCAKASFTIADIEKKPGMKSPAPPFITSTLQQEASRKLGFPVSKTMVIAQQLYESGQITYMRTDSTNLSELALQTAKDEIVKLFGAVYSKPRQFKTKARGAQEAHEAIRPTNISKRNAGATVDQKKLYDLIWKRTVASQMSNAQLERTNVKIDISDHKKQFVAKGEIIKFDGFLKLYLESKDDEEENDEQKGVLPPLKVGDSLDLLKATALQRFSSPAPRYSEASLVKKLEDLGIGRPSTYAPTISTIQKRQYVEKGMSEGKPRKYKSFVLENGKISEHILTEKTGSDKGKLVPTDIGMLVTQFLVKNFDEILDYNFTAEVEKEFDEISKGRKIWNEMIKEFYEPFHERVESTLENSGRVKGERLLGTDPKSGRNVYVRIGRYGPMVQIGHADDEEKPKFAGLQKNQSMDSITLEEALELFKFPREIGTYEDEPVLIGMGRFGPYVKHKNKFVSLKKEDDPATVTIRRAIELIEEKREKERNKYIKTFEKEGIQILNGRWGPYISFEKKNYKIPKETDPKELTVADCKKIIGETGTKKKTSRKKTIKSNHKK
jgi:DNA topoisomerase-1